MKKYFTTLRYSTLILFSVASLFPFYWMIMTAFTKAEWIASPTVFPIPPHLDSFKEILLYYPFFRWVLNTFIIAILGTLGNLFFASLAAFSFACLRWRFRDLIFYMLLLTMMLPGFLMVIPQFFLMVKIGWMDTYWGVFIPGWFSIFSVFLLRQYFFSIPHEVLNAARIDGANLWQIFWRIVMPNSKKVLMALFVISFLGRWNEFFWPLIIIKSQKMETLAVGVAGLGGDFSVDYNQIMAGSVLSLIPIFVLFIFLSKYISKGLRMRITF